MAEYIERKELMKHISPIVYKNGYIANNMASKIVYEIQCEPTADVIERSKIDKAIEEIEDYNIKTNFANCSEAFQLGVTKGLDLASEILKRNIGD